MVKAVIFDFDYTLGDSTNGIALSINYALEKLGYPVRKLDEIKKTIGLSLKATYETLTANQNVINGDIDCAKREEEAEKFSLFFKEKADKVMVENTQLYEGVKETLQILKDKGYKTAIVTTKFHYRIEQILQKFDATELIDLIVGGEDVKVAKPSPEGVLWAMEHLGVAKDQVLYVGDSLVDAKTAENAEVSFAAVLTGTTTKEEFSQYRSVFVGENVPKVYEYLSRNL